MLAIYYWTWSLPSSLINIPSKTPLKKTYFSSASKCQLEIASCLRVEECVHIPPQHWNPIWLELCMFFACCHSLCELIFALVLLRLQGTVPLCLPSTLAFTIFLSFFLHSSMRQGIWSNYTF